MNNAPSQRRRVITNRLWRYRKQHQLSQKHMAVMLGHKKTAQVSRWENGEKTPSLENALKLGYILKVPVETLFIDLAAKLQGEIAARTPEAPGAGREIHRSNEKESAKKA